MKLDYEPPVRKLRPIRAAVVSVIVTGYFSLSFGLVLYEESWQMQWLGLSAYDLVFVLSVAGFGLSFWRITLRGWAARPARSGFCPACGYDLWATPRRCSVCA